MTKFVDYFSTNLYELLIFFFLANDSQFYTKLTLMNFLSIVFESLNGKQKRFFKVF